MLKRGDLFLVPGLKSWRVEIGWDERPASADKRRAEARTRRTVHNRT